MNSNYIKTILTTTFLWLITSLAWANSNVSISQSIDLNNTPDNYELTADLLIVFDTPNTQTLSEALKLNTWVKVNKNSLKAPRQQTITWLKTSIHNTSNQALIRWLVFEPWRLNQVDAFFLNPDTSDLAWHTATGINIPLEDRLIKNGPAYQWCYFQQHSLQEHKRLTFQQKQKTQKPLMLTFPSQLIC